MKHLLLSACALTVLAFTPAVAADHGHGHGHGKAVAIGSATVGTQVMTVLAAGAAKAGEEWHVEVVLTPPTPAPSAVRMWVGVENARGSMKSKADPEAGEPGAYAGHVDLPKVLPDGSMLWISLEAADGTSNKVSVALPASK